MTIAQIDTFPLVPPSVNFPLGGNAAAGILELRNTYHDGRTLTTGTIVHNGSDIGAEPGTIVVAAMDGLVIASGWGGLGGWEIVVRSEGVTSGRKYDTVYAHFLTPPFVKRGERVKAGQVVGLSGATGGIDNAPVGQKFKNFPHLHFSIKRDGAPWDVTPQLLKMMGRRLNGKEHKYLAPMAHDDIKTNITNVAKSFLEAQLSSGAIPPWYVVKNANPYVRTSNS